MNSNIHPRTILALGAVLALSGGLFAEAAAADFRERLEALASPVSGTAEERFQAYVDLRYEYTLDEYPEFATFIGAEGDHGRWTDGSPAAVERQEAFDRRSLEVLRAIPRDELDEDSRLDYDLAVDDLALDVEGQRFPAEYLVLSQLSGVQQTVARMLALMPATDAEDYGHLLARLGGVKKLVEDDLGWLREGLERGITPPRITLRDVPGQIESLAPDDVETGPLLRAFFAMPDSIPAEERKRLREEAISIYEYEIVPAYRDLHAFLVEEYLPGAREEVGISALPMGDEWYAHAARRYTTTDWSAEKIHQIGLSEVRRIRSEMDRVIAESGFEGSFDEFTEFLRTDPRFYFTEEKDLLAAYRDIAKRADAELPKLFGLLPRLTYGVVPVPAFMAPSQTTAYYQRGSVEAGRPGKFFANTHALDTRPKWEMEALTLHEAVPGHHFQIALQQELDLPWFRRFGGYTAFVEGWGLYAESLGEEMGFYTDPYSKFGQLTYEMWRAIRLVVDTGMHALGWSRDRAIEFFVENTGKSEHDIIVEVDRYIVWPGQALAYKIGELKLQELRRRAESELGDAFDIRAFHDTVLGAGALPLHVLEQRIDAWIAERAGG